MTLILDTQFKERQNLKAIYFLVTVYYISVDSLVKLKTQRRPLAQAPLPLQTQLLNNFHPHKIYWDPTYNVTQQEDA